MDALKEKEAFLAEEADRLKKDLEDAAKQYQHEWQQGEQFLRERQSAMEKLCSERQVQRTRKLFGKVFEGTYGSSGTKIETEGEIDFDGGT